VFESGQAAGFRKEVVMETAIAVDPKLSGANAMRLDVGQVMPDSKQESKKDKPLMLRVFSIRRA